MTKQQHIFIITLLIILSCLVSCLLSNQIGGVDITINNNNNDNDQIIDNNSIKENTETILDNDNDNHYDDVIVESDYDNNYDDDDEQEEEEEEELSLEEIEKQERYQQKLYTIINSIQHLDDKVGLSESDKVAIKQQLMAYLQEQNIDIDKIKIQAKIQNEDEEDDEKDDQVENNNNQDETTVKDSSNSKEQQENIVFKIFTKVEGIEETIQSPTTDETTTKTITNIEKKQSSSESPSSSTVSSSKPTTTTTTTTTNTNIKTKEEVPKYETEYSLDFNKVIELNSTNFDRAISENRFVFVLFYASWCARSQALLLEFEETRRVYQYEPAVLFAKVNGPENPTVRDRLSIIGYPVMQLFRTKGGNVTPRGSAFQTDSLITFLKRSTLDAIQKIYTIDQFKQYQSTIHYGLLGIYSDTDNDYDGQYKVFIEMSHKIAFKVPMALVENNPTLAHEILNSIQLKETDELTTSSTPTIKDGIILMKPLENYYQYYNSELKSGLMLKWLVDNFSPLINEFIPDIVNRVSTDKVSTSIILFLDLTNHSTSLAVPGKEISPLLLDLYNIAPKYINNARFYYADGITFRDFSEKLGSTKIPCLAIIEFKKSQHFILNNVPLNQSTMSTFIENFFSRKLKPTTYSELIPLSKTILNNSNGKNNNNNNIDRKVKNIVFNNFKSSIMGSNKTSLVYFNAPWCGFCKTMDVYYRTAAEHLFNQYGNDLQIFEFDVSKNSLPNIIKSKVDGYPYITLFPSLDKLNPIMYNRSRSVDSLIDFVSSNIELQKQKFIEKEIKQQQQQVKEVKEEVKEQQQEEQQNQTKQKEIQQQEKEKTKSENDNLDFEIESIDLSQKEIDT